MSIVQALESRNFAIIADKAHSSQTGSIAKKPKKVFSTEDLTNVNDGGAGQLIAAALMIDGIAVLGVVTATLASWLVESVAEEDTAQVESGDEALQRELAEVKEQLRLQLETTENTINNQAPSRQSPR